MYNNNWQNYNYNNNYKIFIISHYISVYADHAIDNKIIVQLQAIEYLISVGQLVDILWPHF